MRLTTAVSLPIRRGADELDAAAEDLRRDGVAVVAGLYGDAELQRLDEVCAALQQGVVDGTLPERCGTVRLVDSDRVGVTEVVHYVSYTTELSPEIRAAASHPAIVDVMRAVMGPAAWLLESERFGVVYQEARPGLESAYSRIGWHSDWQSGPQLDCWPSVAFTIHLDATSPCNGFLRAVPGSHRWATPAPTHDIDGVAAPYGPGIVGGWSDEPPPVEMPPAFEKVPGEVPVYAERGDVIFHDAYTWHAAARGTDDRSTRRHLRGGYYAGMQFPVGFGIGDFVKNAAR